MTRFESTSSYYWQWHQVTVLYFLSFSYHSSPNHSSSSATISCCAEKVHVSMDNCCACCYCWTRFLGVHLCYHTLLFIEKEKSQEARYIEKICFYWSGRPNISVSKIKKCMRYKMLGEWKTSASMSESIS